MLKKVLLAVAALVALLAVVVALQPDTYRVERSTTVAAPADRVFPRVNDLKAWDAWTPYRRLDPQQKVTVSDPSSGVGASVRWVGNERVGEGVMTIRASEPPSRVALEQEFFKPFAGKADITFRFEPDGTGTRVTWTLSGANDFVGKAMCLVMDMDAMLGPDMVAGLASMKEVVEQAAQEKTGTP